LYFYGARWYDDYLNRWIQPDIIISDPGNSIDWDRYAYARNNPVKYIDPNGHEVKCPQNDCDKPLFVFDYSNLGLGRFVNALAMTAIEVVASPVCWLVVGCHVDWGNNIIIGPTGAESMHNAIAGSANPIAMVASPWAPKTGSIFLQFLPENFRENLMRLTGLSDEAFKGLQAHHVLPQAFRKDFAAAGLNVDDPVFGTWVDSTHQKWTQAYQDAWNEFLDPFRKNDTHPTIEQVFAYAESLADRFGFEWARPPMK